MDIDDDICTPPDILELATKVTHNLLPEKSRKLYEKEYNNFLAWKIEKKTTSFSENVILAYLKELSDKFKPSSMWAKYSMLKSTLSIYNNIDITKYSKVIAFLKRSSEGHKEKKSLTFTSGQIKMFLEDSPDILYLFEKMNQQCKVCGEPAAGFHFGAFTCEGCKSFFGRTYNNLSSISECKNNGECVINKKNRTACKACRLRKCLLVGMSKSGSRYGRRSNWFKIHCLLQEQQHQQIHQMHTTKSPPTFNSSLNPSFLPTNLLPAAALAEYYKNSDKSYTEEMTRQSSPSDSGASSADPEDDNSSRSTSGLSIFRPASSPNSEKEVRLQAIRSQTKDVRKRKQPSIPLSPFTMSPSPSFSPRNAPFLPLHRSVPAMTWQNQNGGDLMLHSPAVAGIAIDQDKPIDLSIKSTAVLFRSPKNEDVSDSEPELSIDLSEESKEMMKNPLDLSLVPKRTEEVPMTG